MGLAVGIRQLDIFDRCEARHACKPISWLSGVTIVDRKATRARVGKVSCMTVFRILSAVMVLLVFTGCDVLQGAGSDDSQDPAVGASPTSFQLSGRVSMRFTLSDVHTCEDLLLADLPRPETEEEVTATIRHREAQTQLDLITERTVSVFDAGVADPAPTVPADDEAAGADGHLATVSTDDEITATEVEGAESAAGTVDCAASTSFSTVLPPADGYTFVVRGISGDPEPVSYEDLQRNGFECDIQINASGRLSKGAPCGIES